MKKFEKVSKIDNRELNSDEIDINVKKEIDNEFTLEELEEKKEEQGQEQEQQEKEPELSTEEKLEKLEERADILEQEITELNELVQETKDKINESREQLGLPPTEENPPSISSEKDKLEKLRIDQENLEKQKQELVSQQEKEKLISEEKEKIIQERLDEVFSEFERINSQDFESILKSGKTFEGQNFKSESMGFLDPEISQSLAKVFKEGIKLLPKIIEALPDFFKKIDEDLTKEAIERVENKLEQEKEKLDKEEKEEDKDKDKDKEKEMEIDGEKEEEKIKNSKNKISSNTMKTENNSFESEKI